MEKCPHGYSELLILKYLVEKFSYILGKSLEQDKKLISQCASCPCFSFFVFFSSVLFPHAARQNLLFVVCF